uniref:Uncharacterized protein n=1 Tax=Arundo donax TaxID=35708 RepID=A0A0A8Y205_ARUDO
MGLFQLNTIHFEEQLKYFRKKLSYAAIIIFSSKVSYSS